MFIQKQNYLSSHRKKVTIIYHLTGENAPEDPIATEECIVEVADNVEVTVTVEDLPD